MGILSYTAQMSLDGCVSDDAGWFGWAEPDPLMHALVTTLHREAGTYLYGRRTYEVMAAWASPDTLAGQPALVQDLLRVWNAAEKIVFSRSLTRVSSPRTRLEPAFDPDRVRALLDITDHEVSIGGPELAAVAFEAGLIDEVHLFVYPVIVGGGHRALPSRLMLRLQLVESRAVGERGVVHLRYAVRD